MNVWIGFFDFDYGYKQEKLYLVIEMDVMYSMVSRIEDKFRVHC